MYESINGAGFRIPYRECLGSIKILIARDGCVEPDVSLPFISDQTSRLVRLAGGLLLVMPGDAAKAKSKTQWFKPATREVHLPQRKSNSTWTRVQAQDFARDPSIGTYLMHTIRPYGVQLLATLLYETTTSRTLLSGCLYV